MNVMTTSNRFHTPTSRGQPKSQASTPVRHGLQLSSPSSAATGGFATNISSDGRIATGVEVDVNNGHADVDLDLLEEIILAINVTDRGSVGCAYYVARDEKLYFMEDIQLGGPDIVDSLKLFINPAVILVSTRCQGDTLDRLDPELRTSTGSAHGGHRDATRLPYLLECRPNAEFGYESARNKLVNLGIGQQGGPSVTYITPGDVVHEEHVFEGDEARFVGKQGSLLRLAGWINMESRLTVGCAGAVISYLQRRRATAYLPGDRGADAMFRIETLAMFSLKDNMFVNSDTIHSLQITSLESHPNAQQQGPAARNWSGGHKEGLSIYGLFGNFAKTQQGRMLLRQYFLRPSTNRRVINNRLDTVTVLLKVENANVLDRIVNALAKVRNMRTVTSSLRKGSTSGLDKGRGASIAIWQSLRHLLHSALTLLDLMHELEGGRQLLIGRKMIEAFDKRRLVQAEHVISRTIDFDSAQDARRCIIRPGVNDELDEAQRTYDGIEDMLSHVVNHVAAKVPAELGWKINVIFFPQIGFLISTQVDEGTSTTGQHECFAGPTLDDRWERMFATETHVYYKNSSMVELDTRFGDIYGNIRDKEIEVLQDLAQNVLEYEDLLLSCSEISGELDCLVALARGANQYNLCRPSVVEENVIKITAGRHPLQELTVASFIPNDTHLVGGQGNDARLAANESIETRNFGEANHIDLAGGGDIDQRLSVPPSVQTRSTPRLHSRSAQDEAGPSMVLLTGPNYSGKSIYLKQVALIVYMAHVGCFVPARSATIGITDKILTRIATRETVSREQSAFMIDLQQTTLALSLATRRSLLIIDEFGKGTDSADGAGLVAGVFEHLLGRGEDCPKILGATHFHEIFENGFLKPRPRLSFAHMEVMVDYQSETSSIASTTTGRAQITYLYNLREGRSTESFGTACARMNGVPEEVVGKAEKLIKLAARGEDLVEACAEMPEAELAELHDAVGNAAVAC
jgi:DNA mismatch repair protein MSH5